MKPRKSIFFVLNFISFLATAQPSSQMNDFAQKLIQAFQTENFNSYNQLCINKESYLKEILPQLKDDTIHHIPEGLINKGINFYQNYSDSARKVVFNSYLKKGKEIGIAIWSKVMFQKFELEGKKIPGNENKLIRGNMWVTYEDLPYVFIGIVAIKLSKGYRLSVIGGIIKVVEKNEQ